MQKNILLQLIILLSILSCQSRQEVDTSKSNFITKWYKNDTLIYEEYYNEDSTYFFSKGRNFISDKWVGKFNTDLHAIQFDKENNILMNLFAHSNAGFEIYIHEEINDTIEHIMKITDGYDRENVGDYKNQFRYINEITSSEELINHPQIKKMLKNGKPYLHSILEKDSSSKILKETTFFEVLELDTTFVSKWFYNKNEDVQLLDYGGSQEHYLYNSDGNLIKKYTIDSSSSVIETLQEEHFYEGKNLVKSISPHFQTQSFEYNQKGQLIKEIVNKYLSKEDEYTEIAYFYKKDKLVKRIETTFPQKTIDEYRFEYIEQ